MALAEQAKRVAAEFDFGDDAVKKAVKEFIREMGMYRIRYCAIGR
jgi:hexokinase